MAQQALPRLASFDFTEALREAAVRKTKAEEERRRAEEESKRGEREKMNMIMQLAKTGLSLGATAYGGPAAGAATSAGFPVAEEIFRSFGE